MFNDQRLWHRSRRLFLDVLLAHNSVGFALNGTGSLSLLLLLLSLCRLFSPQAAISH